MKSKRTLIIGAVVVVLVVVLAFVLGSGKGQPVSVAKAEKGSISTFVEDRAKTTLPRIFLICMPLDGRILPITLKEGDRVKKGDVLARLEPSDLETRLAVAQARMAEIEGEIALNKDDKIEQTALVEMGHWIKAMDDTLSAAKQLVKASQAQFNYSDWELKATERAKRGGAVSNERVMTARRDQTAAAVELAKNQFMTNAVSAIRMATDLGPKYINQWLGRKALSGAVLEQKLKAAQAELAKAQRDLGRAQILSPTDGVVLKRHVQNYRPLASGKALLDIGQMSQLQVTADILSQDAGDVRPGLKAEIYGPALGPKPLSGVVARIKPQGITKLSSLGVEQQRVAVVIDFGPGQLAELQKTGRHLGVAYRVRVRIFTAMKKDALTIPRTALFRAGGQGLQEAGDWRVFAVKGGKAVMRTVSVGLLNDYRAEITQGLQQGEAVILSPPKNLRSGDEVSPG